MQEGMAGSVATREERLKMLKKLMLVAVLVLLAISLAGCDGLPIIITDAETLVVESEPVPAAVVEVYADEVVEEETEEVPTIGLNQLLILAVLTVMVALSNERITELLKKLGVIKAGYSAVWQTVFGSVAFAALALAQYLGIENQLTGSVDALVEFATALAIVIPIFAQSVIAKYVHEVWKKVGFNYSLRFANMLKTAYTNNPDRG